MNDMPAAPSRRRARILVAGIGNLFLGDDAFGLAVVRRLAGRPLPEGVLVADFGIRGFDLACALLDGYDLVVLIDATRRGGPPGTLYLIEPDAEAISRADGDAITGGAHGLDPVKALQWARAMGGNLPPLRLIGCEPATFGSEQPTDGLSPAVEAAVEEAVALVESVVVEHGFVSETPS